MHRSETPSLKQISPSRKRRASAIACLLSVAMSGCAAFLQSRPAPTEADFATIRPGMSSQEVVTRFGPPTWSFGVRQEDLTILNYRFNRNDCIIYQVSVRPDGSVRDAGTAWDPACDGPNGRQ
jgi:hypothetical protein